MAVLDDIATARAVRAERALLAAAGGGCRSPIGAFATTTTGDLELLGGYARLDGSLAVTRTRGSSGAPHAGADADIVDRLLVDLADAAAAISDARGEPRVILGRAVDDMPATTLALVDRGLSPVCVPAIAIEAGDRKAIDAAQDALPEMDWVVVTSANAVRSLASAARDRGTPLAPAGPAVRPRWAAIGRGTERALRAAGVIADVRPEQASGASLADAVPVRPGDRVLLPIGDRASEIVADGLRGRGATVMSVVAYRTIEAPAASAALLASALAAGPRALVCTSGSTVRGFAALAASIGVTDAVRALPIVAIGGPTASEARRLGFTVAAEATAQTPAGIADATARAVHGRETP